MALTAKFVSDFTRFYADVQKATVMLEGFQGDADKVADSLNRVVTSLSGKKLINDATNMVAAVEAIGGASKLTEAEILKVSSTVAAASEKMKLMGIAVPETFNKWSQAAEETKAPVESLGTSMKFLTGVVQGVMGLQIVQWFTQAAGAGFAWASSLTKMQAQTDLTFRDLQILENVAISSGTELGTLTKGIQVMQQKIGDRTARKAIQDLGLSFDALLKMSPADQFAAIATALARIEDPTERNSRAARIFGNTYREITPAIRSDLQNIAKDTKLVGDATIKAAEQAANEWDKAWNEIKKGSVQYLAWLSAMDAARRDSVAKDSDALAAMIAARANIPTVAAPGFNLPSGAGATTRDFDPTMIQNILLAGETLNQQTESVRKNTEEYKKAADAREKFDNAVTNSLERARYQTFMLGQSAVTASQNVAGFNIRQSETVAISRDFSKELTASTIHTDHFGHVVATNVNPTLGKMGKGLIDTTQETVKFDDQLIDLAQSFANLAQASNGAMGTVARQIGTTINAMSTAETAGKQMRAGFEQGGVKGYTALAEGALGAVGAIDSATNSGNKAINTMSGMAAGAKAGMAFGPYGAAIGAAAGAIAGFVKANAFEGKYVSPLRDEFFKMAGGLEILNPQVEKLTGNLDLVKALFDAKTVEDYNAAIAKLNDLFVQEQNALATLTATADKYGLTLEELGPAMARQNLDKQAQTLYKDWQVLNAAGIQTTVITSRMADAINKYIQDAMGMGQEVPEAMRPMIEKMIEMGKLTDSSGNKIDSLENSGISFSLTMSEGFKALITSVEKLADVLSRSLGVAIDSTTTKIGKIPSKVPVEIKYTETGAVPKSGSGTVPGYATGTDGFVDFGAGTLAMLHGREAVIPESAVRNAGGGGGAMGGGVTITINAQGAFFDTPGDLQRLADKVNTALTAKYGLTNRTRAA